MARGSRQSAPVTVSQTLRNWIREGRYQVGSQLPPEPELAALLGTSRVTLREALRMLEEEGLVNRRHGVGTFVASPTQMTNSLHLNFGVTDLIRAMNLLPGTKEARWYERVATGTVQERLQLADGEKVLVLERVRTADDSPVVYSIDYIPTRLISGTGVFVGESLYAFLRDVCQKPTRYGEARIRPVRADARTAQLLNSDTGELLLLLEQVDFDSEDTPILFSKEYHLASAFDFVILRRGPD